MAATHTYTVITLENIKKQYAIKIIYINLICHVIYITLKSLYLQFKSPQNPDAAERGPVTFYFSMTS